MNNRLIAAILIVVALIIVAVLIASFASAAPVFTTYQAPTPVLQSQGQVPAQGAYLSPFYPDADGNYRGGQVMYGLPATSPYASTNVTSYPGPGTRSYYQSYTQPTQYRYQQQTIQPAQPAPSGVVCTADAMQCPDGTYVGRTAPSCQFAACPGR